MTIQVVAMTSLNPDAQGALDTYLGVVGPLMEAAGAEVVSRFELVDSIVGKNECQYVTLVEYPDEASVKAVFDSEAYKSLDAVKRQAFSKYQVSTAASM